MPSTYTGSGIELIGNGEQAGTWGQTTNTNLQIINRMTSEAGAIALSGTTHTLTISDGVLSDGQYAVLVFGGAPSGTNTVTISPNDAKRVFIVSNTSGQTVVLTQGSGGNVTVPNNGKAIVYSNGAGASAAVVDITPLSLTLAAIGAITPTDGNFIVGNGTTWVAESGNTVLTSIGVTATATELNTLDGITATTAELNILDGVTADTAEINILDGVTASTAEINLLDGVTYTLADLNNLTASITELNYVDGVTSAIQTQLDNRVTSNADDALTGGYTTTADNDGSVSSGTYTPDPAGGNMKRILNAGAFTLAAPTASGDYTLVIQITNDSGAGVITTSGFSRVVGDVFTTSVGDDFFVFITKCNSFVSANVQALQ
jgi:hypothetical protein